MATLFEEGSSDEDGDLKINKSYAENYNQWREKEEYQKSNLFFIYKKKIVKDKYGEGAALELVEEADDNTSSESEDEGDGWNSDVEKQFFQTLASLKTKDPSIYDSKQKFFEQQPDFSKPTSKSKTEEKVTLRDYERKLILEKGGKFSDDEDIHPLTFTEEQNQLKKGFKKILDHCDDDDGDLLVKRETNSSEKVREDEEYKEWLKGQKKDITNEEMKVKLKPLKDYWSDPNLDENEKFLKDFFLNKRYKDPEDKNRIPSYDEIVHDSEGDLSEDEKTLEKQRDFELKYNFRFEEPDPEFIKRYPRTIAGSMRKPDTSRKEKRDEIKERKKREKEEKKEELKQLKKYKLKEIQEKLEQLKTITGNQSLPFQDDELDQDFDPESHDRKMGEMFNDEYYHIDESDQKPEFPYDPEIDDENWDEYTGQEGDEEPSTSSKHLGDEPHCEDPDFIMDCDYDANAENTTDELSRRGRRRKKSLFAKKLEKKKPVFDPQQHPNYEEYLEEYYKLDYGLT
nr:EOG090X05XL [Chydorus sphaericus]